MIRVLLRIRHRQSRQPRYLHLRCQLPAPPQQPVRSSGTSSTGRTSCHLFCSRCLSATPRSFPQWRTISWRRKLFSRDWWEWQLGSQSIERTDPEVPGGLQPVPTWSWQACLWIGWQPLEWPRDKLYVPRLSCPKCQAKRLQRKEVCSERYSFRSTCPRWWVFQPKILCFARFSHEPIPQDCQLFVRLRGHSKSTCPWGLHHIRATCRNHDDLRVPFQSIHLVEFSVNRSIDFGNLGDTFQSSSELYPFWPEGFAVFAPRSIELQQPGLFRITYVCILSSSQTLLICWKMMMTVSKYRRHKPQWFYILFVGIKV